MKNDDGVSVIIGTLLLILVVTVGVLGIATMVGVQLTDTSKHMNTEHQNSASDIPIYVSGSDDMYELNCNLANLYETPDNGFNVITNIISPDGVYSSLTTKTSDIGMLSGKIDYATVYDNQGLKAQQIGEGAVVVIAYPKGSNDTFQTYSNLTTDFANPSDVTITRSDQSGTVDTFYNFLDQNEVVGINAVDGDAAEIMAVSTTPNSIGFADYGDVINARQTSNIKVDIVGIADSNNQQYPIDGITYKNLTTVAKDTYLSQQFNSNGSPLYSGNQTTVPYYSMSLMYPLNYVTLQYQDGVSQNFRQWVISPAASPAFVQSGDFSLAQF